MDLDNDLNKNKGIKDLIAAGAEITGSAMAAAIGAFLFGPAGAIIGGASGPLIERAIIHVGNDIHERFLSEREKIRIGGVIIYATNKIQKRLEAGEKLRDDGFFEKPPAGHVACAELPFIERPIAQEVIEGVLLVARNAYEEKKLPYLGNLLVNIAFDPTIDRLKANFLIKLAESLTYRQLCILSVFSDPYRQYFEGRIAKTSEFPKSTKLTSLVQEFLDLGSKGLLYRGSYEAVKVTTLNFPMAIEVIGAGSDLYRLMELKGLNEADLDPILFTLLPEESIRYPPQKRYKN